MQVGKTRLCNQLADISVSSSVYDPTVGVRILEFERKVPVKSRDGTKETMADVSVEMWDMSGDLQFESCWPAIEKDCTGVVIVLNLATLLSKDVPFREDVEYWYHGLVSSSKSDHDVSQCLVLLLNLNETEFPNTSVESAKTKIAGKVPAKTKIVAGTLKDMNKEIDIFIGKILAFKN